MRHKLLSYLKLKFVAKICLHSGQSICAGIDFLYYAPASRPGNM